MSTVINPWTVSTTDPVIDYEKIRVEFGASSLTPELLDRFSRLTGKRPHPLMRRNIFAFHRDFSELLDDFEKYGSQSVFLYTGRGPSSESMHLGHLIPFQITQYLQEAFDCPVVIQVTDDEKYQFKDGLKLEDTYKFGFENMRDIIACGFDLEKTFIFSNMDYMGAMYPTVCEIQKRLTLSQIRGAFGFNESDAIGKWAWPPVQIAPCCPSAFPHIFNGRSNVRVLIPCAIDQDVFFKVARDILPRMGFQKPSLVLSKFISSLQGHSTKMSASSGSPTLFLTDTPKEIETKINKYALSGGRETLEEHREKGGDCEIDVAYQFLTYFLESDDRLAEIREAYSSGRMTTAELKSICVDTLKEVVSTHQTAKAKVTNELVCQFMDPTRGCFSRFHQ